jgi:hypothetical protein
MCLWLKGADDDSSLCDLFSQKPKGIAVARLKDGEDLG